MEVMLDCDWSAGRFNLRRPRIIILTRGDGSHFYYPAIPRIKISNFCPFWNSLMENKLTKIEKQQTRAWIERYFENYHWRIDQSEMRIPLWLIRWMLTWRTFRVVVSKLWFRQNLLRCTPRIKPLWWLVEKFLENLWNSKQRDTITFRSVPNWSRTFFSDFLPGDRVRGGQCVQ